MKTQTRHSEAYGSMGSSRQAQVTRLLVDYSNGNHAIINELLPMIYDEMRVLAHRQRRRNYAGHTLNTTALVHEAYVKLVGQENPSWQNRVHFFRVAARAMRQILVDYARRQRAVKRGGDQRDASLDELADWKDLGLMTDSRADEVIALDEALQQLAKLDERQSEIVEMRYFTGFTIPETAEALDLSPATVKREWATARAWLYREINQER